MVRGYYEGAVNSLSDSVVTCDIGRWVEQSGTGEAGSQ